MNFKFVELRSRRAGSSRFWWLLIAATTVLASLLLAPSLESTEPLPMPPTRAGSSPADGDVHVIDHSVVKDLDQPQEPDPSGPSTGAYGS